MQAWVRNLSIAALAVGALALVAGTPALAYDDPTPNTGNFHTAWSPQYTAVAFAEAYSNEGGPVELPRPIDRPEGAFSLNPGAQPATPQNTGKSASSTPTLGALPLARSAGPIIDPAAQAERSVQQVIKRLG